MENGFCYNTTATSQLCHLPDKDLPKTETVADSLAYKIFTYVSVIYVLVISKLYEEKMSEFVMTFGQWLQTEWCYCVEDDETCNACKDDEDQKHKKRPEPPVAENEVEDEVQPDLQVPALLDDELRLLYIPHVPRAAPAPVGVRRRGVAAPRNFWQNRRRRARRFH